MARAVHAPPTVASAAIGADAPLASIVLISLGVAFHISGSLLLLAGAPPLASLHAFAAFIVLAAVAATHQLLPVLLGVAPVPWRLTLGTGLGFASGFVMLVAGFFGAPTFLCAALLLVLTATVWFTAVLTRVAVARMERFTAAVIGIAVFAFGVAAWLGGTMAYDFSRALGFSARLAGVHGSLMLLLFASLLIVTLSYRFVPMFALSHANAYGRRGLLLVVIAALLAAVLLPDRRPGLAATAVAFAILGYQHLQTLHSRIRAKLDMSLTYAATAWILAFAAAMSAAIVDVTNATASALIALTVLGWLSITIFGYGMKIVGFLAWQFARAQTSSTALSPLCDAIPPVLASSALAALALGALGVAASKIAGLEVLSGSSTLLYAAGSVLYGATLVRIAFPYLRTTV